MYAIGGYDGNYYMFFVESYDPLAQIWTEVASMTTARANHAVGVLTGTDGEEYLYAFGGYNRSQGHLQSVEKYDPSNGTWADVASMPTKRQELEIGVLTDNATKKRYLYGVGGSNSDNTSFDTMMRYDPSNDAWTTAVASMHTARKRLGVGAVTHSNDRKQYLYAVGGYNNTDSQLQSVERYDPSNDTWTEVSPMGTKREGLAVGVLAGSDGKQYLYAAGGKDGSGNLLDTVERYDPSNDEWEEVASMQTNRKDFAAGVVTEADGKQYLYAAGGLGGAGTALQNVERYDPLTNIWTDVRPMSRELRGLARLGVGR